MKFLQLSVQYSMIAVGVLLFTVVLGLAIVKVVDHRMANVSIKMPHVDVHIDSETLEKIKKNRAPLVEKNQSGGSNEFNKNYIHEDNKNTYYSNPDNLCTKDKNRLKLKAKFCKMTLQDYKNWLNLYLDLPETLPMKHQHNFYKLKLTNQLTYDDFEKIKDNNCD